MIVGSLIYQSKLSFILDFGRNPTIILVPDKEIDKIANGLDRNLPNYHSCTGQKNRHFVSNFARDRAILLVSDEEKGNKKKLP